MSKFDKFVKDVWSAFTLVGGEDSRIAYESLVTQAERQRIVNLLENPLHHNIKSPDIHKNCYTCVLIALIKGEQK